MKWRIFLCGVLFLLVSAYLDNSRGVLLPVFSDIFKLDHVEMSLVLIAGNIGAVVASFGMLYLNRHFSLWALGKGTAVFGAVVLTSIIFVGSYPALLAIALFLGATYAVLGTMSSLFAIRASDAHNRSRAMAGLHMMYGFGSLLGPKVSAGFIAAGWSWQAPLLIALPCLFALPVVIGSSHKKTYPVGGPAVMGGEHAVSMRLNLPQCLIVLTFCFYVIGEVLLSMWMVTYLRECYAMESSAAAWYATGFFLVLGLSRGALILLRKSHLEHPFKICSILLAIGAIYLGFEGHLWGFALAGILGPFYPLLLARATREFPEQAQVLTLWIVAGIQSTLAVSHFTLGRLADEIGIRAAYSIPPFFLGAAVLSYLCFSLVQNRRVSS